MSIHRSLAVLSPLIDLSVPTDLVPEVAALLAPLLTVAAMRVADVTLGVFKTTAVVNGQRSLGALFAAVEALVWVAAAGLVLSDLSLPRMLAYAVGVGAGTWLGMAVVHQLRLGLVTVRAFVPVDDERTRKGFEAAARIRALGYGATVFDGYGRDGRVQMVLSVVRRREVSQVCGAVQGADERAFVALDNAPGPSSVICGLAGSPA